MRVEPPSYKAARSGREVLLDLLLLELATKYIQQYQQVRSGLLCSQQTCASLVYDTHLEYTCLRCHVASLPLVSYLAVDSPAASTPGALRSRVWRGFLVLGRG